MLETEYSGFRVNTIPVDALAPEFASASAGMVLALQLQDGQYVCSKVNIPSTLVKPNSRYDQNVDINISFIIFKQFSMLKWYKMVWSHFLMKQ